MKPTLSFGLAFLSQETLFLKARADDCTKDNVDAWIGGESLECPTSWVGLFNAPTSHMWLPGFRDCGIPKIWKFTPSVQMRKWLPFPTFPPLWISRKKMMLGRRSGFLSEGRPIFRGTITAAEPRQPRETTQGCHHKALSQDGISTPNKQPTP